MLCNSLKINKSNQWGKFDIFSSNALFSYLLVKERFSGRDL